MANQIPDALIVVWGGKTLRANCPFCLKTHGHGFSQEPRPRNDMGTRRSDCFENGGVYRLVFADQSPRHASGHGWELDRARLVFELMNAEGKCFDPSPTRPYRALLPEFSHSAEEHNEEMIESFDRLNVEESQDDEHGRDAPPNNSPREIDEEFWQQLFASQDYRKSVYISACVTRDVPELRRLLRTYPADNFPSVSNAEGQNGILLAATEEKAVDTIELLRAHGAALDKADHYGRTPLMEAALWGRLDAVHYLARTEEVDVRAIDGNGMTALDLALVSERNQGERRERAGNIYREPSQADEDRLRIESYLRRLVGNSANPGALGMSSNTFFQRSTDGNISLYRAVLQLLVPIRGDNKAFAELDRGGGYPLLRAMSGYSHPRWPNVLDNETWASRANDLRVYVGLEESLSLASHVEPQLIAYLIYHHSTFSIDGTQWELDASAVRHLASSAPNYTLQPTITISKDGFCCWCRDFKDLMKEHFQWLNVRFRFVGDSVGAQVRIEEW